MSSDCPKVTVCQTMSDDEGLGMNFRRWMFDDEFQMMNVVEVSMNVDAVRMVYSVRHTVYDIHAGKTTG